MVTTHLTDTKGEVRELTKADFAEMKPFKEVFPELHESWKQGRGRPKNLRPTARLTVRLDADVVAWLKQNGALHRNLEQPLIKWGF